MSKEAGLVGVSGEEAAPLLKLAVSSGLAACVTSELGTGDAKFPEGEFLEDGTMVDGTEPF
jgi:hypothetical protein